MGSGKRGKSAKSSSPGPGSYADKYKVTKKKGPSYYMGTKSNPNFEYLKQSPGPGTYAMKGISSGKGWSFGGRNTISHDGKVPGPGAYDSGSTFQRGGNSFGTEKRGR